jgi:hypothetical protein
MATPRVLVVEDDDSVRMMLHRDHWNHHAAKGVGNRRKGHSDSSDSGSACQSRVFPL